MRRRPTNTNSEPQKLVVKLDQRDRPYWHSDAPGWVPHRQVELDAKNFAPGDHVVIYASESPSASEK